MLLNSALQGCPALQEGQHPIVLLLHVIVLVDDLRVDVGDYVNGVLLCQALRGECDLELDILRREGRQSQGHQCIEEIVTIVAVEGGGHRRAWARGLEAYVKVVRELHDDGELVEEADEDLVTMRRSFCPSGLSPWQPQARPGDVPRCRAEGRCHGPSGTAG